MQSSGPFPAIFAHSAARSHAEFHTGNAVQLAIRKVGANLNEKNIQNGDQGKAVPLLTCLHRTVVPPAGGDW